METEMHLDRRTFMGAAAAIAAAPACPLPAVAQGRDLVTGSAIRADLDLLRRAFETVHPGLTRYLPAGGFADRIRQAQQWSGSGRSTAELFVALARLTSAVKCGHTYPNPNNQQRTIEDALLSRRDRVPFTFRWFDGRMIVTGERKAGLRLAPGTEVLSIDGVPVRELFRAMLPLTRADGRSEGKRIAQLGITADERYPAFDVYRPLLFPVRSDGMVRVSARPFRGALSTLDLPALTEAELQASRKGRSDAQSWTFAMQPEGVGLLTMPDWVTYRSKWDWKGYLDGILDRLIDERARGLVIDLRGNEGGTECGWHILERLLVRDFPLPPYIYKTRYRTLPADLHKPLDTWDPTFRDWGAAASGPDADGFYLVKREQDMAGVLRPRGRRFTGKLVVLVDAACSSATFQFARAIELSGVATLVGEPTGGNRRGINGGAYFFVRLPETGLEVDLPIIGSFPPTRQADTGVAPGVKISPTISDIADGRDRALEASIALVHSSLG
jgi:hypothetical protein